MCSVTTLKLNIFYLQPDCPRGYQKIVEDSIYCYKVMKEKLTWESARAKCKNDEGDMVCFANRKERDKITSVCDGCWAGYNWEDGKCCYLYSYP